MEHASSPVPLSTPGPATPEPVPGARPYRVSGILSIGHKTLCAVPCWAPRGQAHPGLRFLIYRMARMLSRDRGSAGPVPFAQAPGLASKAPPRRLPYSSRRRPPRSYPWAFVPAVPPIALPPATGGPDCSASSCTARPGPCVDSLETPGRGHGCPQSGQHPIWAHGAGVLRPLTPVHVGRRSQAGRGAGSTPAPPWGWVKSRCLFPGGSAQEAVPSCTYLEQKWGRGLGDMDGGRGRLHTEATSQGPRGPGPGRTGRPRPSHPAGQGPCWPPRPHPPALGEDHGQAQGWRSPCPASWVCGDRDACGVGEPAPCGAAGAGVGLCSHSRAGSQRTRRETTAQGCDAASVGRAAPPLAPDPLHPLAAALPFDARPRWHHLQNRKQKQPPPPQACASHPCRASLSGPGQPGLQQRWPCTPSQGGLHLPERVGPGTTSWEPVVLQSALPLPSPWAQLTGWGGAEDALAACEQGPLPRAPGRCSWESCSGAEGCDGAGRAGGRRKRPWPLPFCFRQLRERGLFVSHPPATASAPPAPGHCQEGPPP